MARYTLKLNDDKIEFLLVESRHHINSVMDSDPNLVAGNEEIRPSRCVRGLDATCDSCMDMAALVDRVTR